MLTAISPIDGRYHNKTEELSAFFSEYALIKYRVLIEVHYFIALCDIPLPQLQDVPEEKLDELVRLCNRFSLEDAQKIKDIEKVTNHDVKAVEYFLKETFEQLGLIKYQEFVHFGLTSQDINNTAVPLSLKHATEEVYLPQIRELITTLRVLSEEWEEIPMLARTHGQPASPTSLGKEIAVFAERLRVQLEQLEKVPFNAKFGGATGNLNAHYITYPAIDWHGFANRFISDALGMKRSHPTTQIEHYDNLAALFQAMKRINTILIDLSRDVWTYISMEYFKQKVVVGEIGSSAMPHKVNPIDFENAEGNLGVANAIFTHLADKLPISRLQRDLTDSTVLRNIGVPIAHTIIAGKSLLKGISKITLNSQKIHQELEQHWIVVAEALQNILRREGYPKPYEALLDLTRGKDNIGQAEIHAFINGLKVDAEVKAEMKRVTPHNYIGK